MVSSVTELTGKSTLVELYKQVRSRTMQIVAPLEIEDYVIQTAEFMSPARWHIGHTSTWLSGLLRRFPLLLQLILRGIRCENRTTETWH
jgi:DinB family protein